MLYEDQRPWKEVLQLAQDDADFAHTFQRKFDARGGWDMAAIAEWTDAPPVVAAYRTAHNRNCIRFREIVEANGWPTRTAVGEEAADAAWLLLQHFGNLDFQKRCLELLLALPPAERDLKHYAFTFDLLCKVEGRVPRFGTMGLPVEEEDNLDQLRAEFDLPPLGVQESNTAAGLVVLPGGIGRQSPGFGWPER